MAKKPSGRVPPVTLALVRAGYEDLIGLRDSLSPQTRLFLTPT